MKNASVTITKYEQSCFMISIENKNCFLFDPGSETSMQMILNKGCVSNTYVSHSHGDHFDIKNLKLLNGKIWGAKEVVEGLKAENVASHELVSMETIEESEISITPFDVDHGPISTPIVNLGFKINVNNVRILYLGDIAVPLALDLKDFQIVLIPVGGGKVFSPEQAYEYLKVNGIEGIAVPIHYHGRADRNSGMFFKEIVNDEFKVKVLEVGESITIDDNKAIN